MKPSEPEEQLSFSEDEDPLAMQPMAQALDRVQLFVVPAGPDLQECRAPAVHPSPCVDPPHTVPETGTPRMFVTVQV